jgi:hypothetical protein
VVSSDKGSRRDDENRRQQNSISSLENSSQVFLTAHCFLHCIHQDVYVLRSCVLGIQTRLDRIDGVKSLEQISVDVIGGMRLDEIGDGDEDSPALDPNDRLEVLCERANFVLQVWVLILEPEEEADSHFPSLDQVGDEPSQTSKVGRESSQTDDEDQEVTTVAEFVAAGIQLGSLGRDVMLTIGESDVRAHMFHPWRV